MRILELYDTDFYRGMKLIHQLMFLSLAAFVISALTLTIATVIGLVIWSIVAVVGIFDGLLGTCFLWIGLLSIEGPLVVMLARGIRALFLHEFFTGRKERC